MKINLVAPACPLFLVFLTLKLTGNIDWSWWWVTAPVWVPFGLLLVIALVCGLLGIAIKLLE